MERRLAAILAADVVGYSRLMDEDEQTVLRNLRSCDQEVIETSVARHRGRIVKRMGESLRHASPIKEEHRKPRYD